MAEVTARPLQVSARLPTKEDADAIGAKAPIIIEQAPYVREKLTGMVHFWQPWMRDMGDVLESCWEAPAAPQVVVPTSPLDLAHYGTPTTPSRTAPPHELMSEARPVLPAAEQSARSSPRQDGEKGAVRPPVKEDGNAR